MGSWCVPVLFSQNCASHHSPWHSMREYHYRYEVFKFDTYSISFVFWNINSLWIEDNNIFRLYSR